MNTAEFDEVLARLRRLKGEPSDIEVKLADGGLPESVMPTLSAFANRPGGGLILLGVDEVLGFEARGVADPPAMVASLANKAREGFDPPISIDISVIEGLDVVAARVLETPQSHKPCRRRGSGEAFMRFGEGDFKLSEAEIEGFVANRTSPRFDRVEVDGAQRSDLDSDLVVDLCGSARRSSAGLRKIVDDDDLMTKLGALTPDGIPTVAGMLALGQYPQQWFPNFVIRAGARTANSVDASVRFDDVAVFDGPVPAMIDAAINWARGNSRQRVVESADGHVRTEGDIPGVVLRELIANAVVHRDLAPWSWSRAVDLRMSPNQLVISNPGGLWGTSVDRLGIEQLTSARNEALIRICQHLRLQDQNVIEAMATGIPRVIEALDESGLPPARFVDEGIRFTVLVGRSTSAPTLEGRTRESLTMSEQRVLEALRNADPLSSTEIGAMLGVSQAAARGALSGLVKAGIVTVVPGSDGRHRRYAIVRR
jgi:ATP-dependent DNA helicase RecG